MLCWICSGGVSEGEVAWDLRSRHEGIVWERNIRFVFTTTTRASNGHLHRGSTGRDSHGKKEITPRLKRKKNALDLREWPWENGRHPSVIIRRGIWKRKEIWRVIQNDDRSELRGYAVRNKDMYVIYCIWADGDEGAGVDDGNMKQKGIAPTDVCRCAFNHSLIPRGFSEFGYNDVPFPLPLSPGCDELVGVWWCASRHVSFSLPSERTPIT